MWQKLGEARTQRLVPRAEGTQALGQFAQKLSKSLMFPALAVHPLLYLPWPNCGSKRAIRDHDLAQLHH